jgi:hypothetical protein
MEEVTLYTNDDRGFHVVAHVRIPPMDPAPEVIIWGTRIFVRHTATDGMERYIEGLAVEGLAVTAYQVGVESTRTNENA